MDSGLGVRWPLSPYATALAAGALFAFCVALWKQRTGPGKGTTAEEDDPWGRTIGRDLDSKKEQDECSNKPGKGKKNEKETESAQNFPVLALRDARRAFSYEHLCLSGQFGAIPRTPQRNRALENPNLYSAFRWRNAKKEKKNWQEFNTTSSNFSCIYQQSSSLATEFPRLNAGFFINISPHLQSCIRQFRDIQIPEIPTNHEFDNFDVSLKPEILQNKPITRSAVCLALQRQLHKFLEEPFREIKLSERAIQTADISEEDDEGASGGANVNESSDVNADKDADASCEPSSEAGEHNKKISFDSSSSLWDSGYGEKAFDERCSTPKELHKDVLMEEFSDAFTTETNEDCENLGISKYSELLKRSDEDARRETTHDDGFIVHEEQNNDTINLSEVGVPNTEPNDVFSCSDTILKLDDVSAKITDNLFNGKIQDASDRDGLPEFPNEHVDNESTGTEILNEEIKDLSFDDNVNVLQCSEKCSDKELGEYRDDIRMSTGEEKCSNKEFEKYRDVIQMSTGEEKCSNKELEKYPDDIQMSSSEENILDTDSDIETLTCASASRFVNLEILKSVECLSLSSGEATGLERVQNSVVEEENENQKPRDENLFRVSENMSVKKKESGEKNPDHHSNNSGEVDAIKSSNLGNLEGFQNEFERSAGEQKNRNLPLSSEESEKRNLTAETSPARDVTEGGSSRDPAEFDHERGTALGVPRQMDRETGERSVAVESTVTTEFKGNCRDGAARLSTAVVSRLTLDDWVDREESVSVRTTVVNEDVFRPTFEEFVPLKSSEKISEDDGILRFESDDNSRLNSSGEDLPASPRVDRLKGLISRDEQRRARTKFHHLAGEGGRGATMEGEWDRLLRDVLASVSELERWEQRRHCGDVSGDAEDAEQQQQQHHQQHPFFSLQSDSSFAMEEEALPSSPIKEGETPTKVKSLRFKLDPDVFDVPSDDSFYDDDDYDVVRRGGWKRQQSSKYRAFSSLELKNDDEPVRLVSVHASVVPPGQKMVARPVGIDLRVRLTEERQSKRAHVSTSPSQAKRRSPVSDRGWCQELSPVTENVDWRETFTPVTPPPDHCKSVVPNGILKTPSPKTEPTTPVESPNPFRLENGVAATTNGVNGSEPKPKPKYNGWKPPIERKPFLIIRKKFEPDPEAIERITGYKSALSKPPLPPPLPHKVNSTLAMRNRAEMARKQYLDNKAALAGNKIDSTKKFQQFLSQAQSDRAKIVTSVPDLAAIERAVTEQWIKERASVSPRESPGREDNPKTEPVTLSRGSTPDDKWASYVQSCRQHLGRRSQSMTYLETDIDIIPVLDEDDKCHSTSALDEPDEALPADPDDSDLERSREDLDDSGRAKSEHELRIERSLRSLPLPDWYRRSEKTKTGFLLGSSNNKEKRGWAAAKSLASSTSSLASCGLRRPVRSLRSSRENIPWSRASASPDGPTLSLALAKAFREPYLGWRARTPTSSGVSSSPRASPPSWGATTTDDEANGVSFDGEDAFGRTTSSEEDRRDEPLSLDDTGADAVTVSMDTNDPVKLPGGEDTCDDINNMSMDTCELFDASVVVPVDEDPSPQADTGDDIDNLSTDTTTTEGRKLDPKLKRYSYSQSIYHSEWDEDEESRGDRKVKKEDEDEDRDDASPSSSDHKVVWIESSFVGSRTTTSIMVLPEKKVPGSTQDRPASR